MSPLPPGGEAALNVPATPQDAIRQDALAGEAQALPTAALGTEKKSEHMVMFAVEAARKDGNAEAYFAQVYSGSADDLYYITSIESLIRILREFASIDHMIILSHSFDISLLYGRTPAQVQTALAPVMPAVSRLTLDGCTAGREVVQLYDMATAFKLAELQAWTYFHHIEVWGRPSTKPDPNEDLSAVLEFAAPYVPRGESGAYIPASELQAQLDANGIFAVATEFFTYNLDDHLTFETLTLAGTQPGATGPPLPEPWTRARAPSEAQYPRSALERLEIKSRTTAEANLSKVKAVEAMPYRIIILP